MKIIDILVKMVNGERLPKKIKYDDKIWCLKETSTVCDYYTDDVWPFLDEYITLHFDLTDVIFFEVEILEN